MSQHILNIKRKKSWRPEFIPKLDIHEIIAINSLKPEWENTYTQVNTQWSPKPEPSPNLRYWRTKENSALLLKIYLRSDVEAWATHKYWAPDNSYFDSLEDACGAIIEPYVEYFRENLLVIESDKGFALRTSKPLKHSAWNLLLRKNQIQNQSENLAPVRI